MWSPALTDAFDFAAKIHQNQKRKGTSIPYLAHLLGVASLVLEWGGGEDAVITALLHDTVEDGNGRETLDQVRERFGGRVADLVEACTDSMTQPKPDWQQRKEQFLVRLADTDPEALLVIGADKLYNLRAIYTDYRQIGEAVWERFRGRRDGTLWYYKELNRILGAVSQPNLQTAQRELDKTYSRLLDWASAAAGRRQ